MKSLIWDLLGFLVFFSPIPVGMGTRVAWTSVDALAFKITLNEAIAAPKANYRFDETQYIEVTSRFIEAEVRSL